LDPPLSGRHSAENVNFPENRICYYRTMRVFRTLIGFVFAMALLAPFDFPVSAADGSPPVAYETGCTGCVNGACYDAFPMACAAFVNCCGVPKTALDLELPSQQAIQVPRPAGSRELKGRMYRPPLPPPKA
jgi:hypothetical protein